MLRWAKFLILLPVALCGNNCGSSGKSSKNPGGTTQDGEEPTIRSTITVTDADVGSSLNGLPVLASLLGSVAESHLLLAGDPTAPLLGTLSKDSVPLKITDYVETVVNAQASALADKYWTVVQDQGKLYRDALNKCYAFQDVGWSLSAFLRMSRRACYLRLLDQPEASMVRRVSGEDVARGALFTAGASEVVRVLEISGLNLDQTAKVVAKIQAKSKETGIYQVKVTYCRANGSPIATDTIRIDYLNKTLDLTFNSGFDANRRSIDYFIKSIVNLKGSWLLDGKSVSVDRGKSRSLTVYHDEKSSATDQRTFRSELVFFNNLITEKIFTIHNTATTGNSRRAYANFSYAASKPSDLIIDKGAVKTEALYHPLSASDGPDIPYQYKLGFEFKANVAPEFPTTLTSSALDAVALFDIASDPLLGANTLADPDLSTIDGSACSLTGSTVMRTAVSPSQLEILQKSCDLSLDDTETMCDLVDVYEGQVLRALKASPKGIP